MSRGDRQAASEGSKGPARRPAQPQSLRDAPPTAPLPSREQPPLSRWGVLPSEIVPFLSSSVDLTRKAALTPTAALVCWGTVHRKRYSGPVSVLALLLAIAGAFLITSPEPAAAQETVTILGGDTWFCAASFQSGVCDTEINVGDTVVWDFSGAQLPHTTTACGASCDDPTSSPLWDSGIISDGSTFQFTFQEPGTYPYYCVIHVALQQGRITVRAAEPTATPQTPIEDGTPGAVPPSATPGPGLPRTGYGPGGSSGGWALATLAAAGLALMATAAGLRMIRRAR